MYIYTRTLRYVLIDSVEPFDRAFIIRFFEATRRTEENAPTNYRPLSNSIWIYKPSPYIERSDAKCLIDPADLYLPTVYRVQYTKEGRENICPPRIARGIVKNMERNVSSACRVAYPSRLHVDGEHRYQPSASLLSIYFMASPPDNDASPTVSPSIKDTGPESRLIRVHAIFFRNSYIISGDFHTVYINISSPREDEQFHLLYTPSTTSLLTRSNRFHDMYIRTCFPPPPFFFLRRGDSLNCCGQNIGLATK